MQYSALQYLKKCEIKAMRFHFFLSYIQVQNNTIKWGWALSPTAIEV